MTTNEAKEIPIDEILLRLGFVHERERRSGDELWYLSPFREEKTPSFKVTVSKNLFYDFGEGKGGNALDLVIGLLSTDVKGALDWLGQMRGEVVNEKPEVFRRKPVRNRENEDNPLVLVKVKSLENTALIDYLKSRCIDIKIARKYAAEVYYENTRNNKRYFGVGFRNLSEGYAVRNKYCKSLVGESNISFLEGDLEDGRLDVFEGFCDFLSHRSINRYFPDNDAIVLNSTSHFKKAVELINGRHYTEITLWHDNDDAGRKLLEAFQQEFAELMYIRSQAHLYQEHNDLNAYWKHLQEEMARV
jgi:5S rRNA maturation endonuclease (ribonuclease M5)